MIVINNLVPIKMINNFANYFDLSKKVRHKNNKIYFITKIFNGLIRKILYSKYFYK